MNDYLELECCKAAVDLTFKTSLKVLRSKEKLTFLANFCP
jgi:hypothetical protein